MLAWVLAGCGCGSTPDPLAGGQNPVIQTQGLADPHAILHEGRYYLYPTGDARGYDVYVSDDLLDWTWAARVFDYDSTTVWAPDVYYDDATELFYLYYSAMLQIGVAIADNPLGPFVDQGILIDRGIDGHLFRDDDGALYLYYEGFFGGSRMAVQRMRTLTELEGEPVELFEPEGWEINGALGVVEAPWMLKRNGIYYLMYSGNDYHTEDYAVGYATATNPMGPFVRYAANPIMSKADGVIGPGHHSVVEAPDGGLAIIYHQKRTPDTSDNRFVSVDRMGFDASGVIWTKPTPLNPERLPSQ